MKELLKDELVFHKKHPEMFIPWVIYIWSALFFAATIFLVTRQRDDLKQQAVERGCAEWVVKSDGSTTWQWKETTK